MKKHLHILLAATALCGFSRASAADVTPANPTTPVIEIVGATSRDLPLKTDTKISFDGENLVVTNGDSSSSFTLADITSVVFNLEFDSAEEISEELSGITVSNSGGILTVTAPDNQPLQVSLYTISGQNLFHTNTEGAVTIDLSGLRKGVYIIKANNKTIKFTR